MIRAFITDFGGVLMRTSTDTSRRKLEAELGLTANTIETQVFMSDLSTRAQHGEISADAFWEQTVRNLAASMSIREFRRRFFADDALDQELMTLIRSFRPKYKTAIISNAWLDARKLFTDVLHIADAFDEIVISAEEKIMKPDPRIYQLTLDRLGVQAEQALFLDDLRANVRAAQTLGMHGIHFKTAQQVMQEVKQLVESSS